VERNQRVDRGISLGMDSGDLMGERKRVVVVVRTSEELGSMMRTFPKNKERERKTKSGLICYRTV
jgi:hypothetical protein